MGNKKKKRPEIIARNPAELQPPELKVSENQPAPHLIGVHQLTIGPLPPTKDFQEYEKTLEGAANRIMAMAEKEQAHRHEIESGALGKHTWSINFGKALSFIVSISFIVGAVIVSIDGNPWNAGVLAIMSVLPPIIRMFVDGEKTEEKENE